MTNDDTFFFDPSLARLEPTLSFHLVGDDWKALADPLTVDQHTLSLMIRAKLAELQDFLRAVSLPSATDSS